MNAKEETKVMLKCDAIGVESMAFAFDHAERLLKMPRNGGWELNDNNFEFDEEHGLTKRRKNKAGVRASK